jgi:hypothetical protein
MKRLRLLDHVMKSSVPDVSNFLHYFVPGTLGQSIEGATNDLGTIAMSHRSREAEMIKAIAAAVQNLAIAEAHVRAMKVA